MQLFNLMMLDLAGLARGIFSEGGPVSNFVPTLQGWFALILMLVVTTVLVLALYYNARAYQPPHFEHAHAGEHEVEPKPAPVVAADDLEIIEGIGPKIASVLQANGIRSYAQLAASDPQQIEAILRQAGLRLADATTWPEQARLAAAGDWQGLAELTNQLKAGRRS
jgi:predicted flap endonuclease-1-like 5' DNA nuclease